MRAGLAVSRRTRTTTLARLLHLHRGLQSIRPTSAGCRRLRFCLQPADCWPTMRLRRKTRRTRLCRCWMRCCAGMRARRRGCNLRQRCCALQAWCPAARRLRAFRPRGRTRRPRSACTRCCTSHVTRCQNTLPGASGSKLVSHAQLLSAAAPAEHAARHPAAAEHAARGCTQRRRLPDVQRARSVLVKAVRTGRRQRGRHHAGIYAPARSGCRCRRGRRC